MNRLTEKGVTGKEKYGQKKERCVVEERGRGSCCSKNGLDGWGGIQMRGKACKTERNKQNPLSV